MSFMTLLGLFLIYGLSVDYGIFSTDLFTESDKSTKTESSFNFGLILTWLTNFLGFAPLLMCRHPILKDLGLVLVIGMIGVFYGTFFVVPAVFYKKVEA
jgi:predicted RND superfamily exporter protein